MIKWLVSLARSLEDVNHPLLGPNIKSLKVCGLILLENMKYRICFYISQVASFLFVSSLFVDLFVTTQPFDELLFNLSVAAVSAVSLTKTACFLYWQESWVLLINNISTEERTKTLKLDPISLDMMKDYTKYSRFVTYVYWVLVAITSLAMISSPFLKYISTPDIRSGIEPFPTMISSWFPFNDKKLPGSAIAFLTQCFMCILGSIVIAAFDATSVTIMSFLKGQTVILHKKCREIFGLKETISNTEVFKRIQECHRHHEFLLQQYQLFDSLLSPVMFIYVLVCSMSICCSVVQLSMSEVHTSQKLWVLEYTVALSFQLFIYCWHGNEVTHQSCLSDRVLFESNWWRGNRFTLKQFGLLDGKLFDGFVMNAGPFNTLSIESFINIMKGAYSFFVLFTQKQENA